MKKRLLFAVAALAFVVSIVGLAQTNKQRGVSSTTTTGPVLKQAEPSKADLLKEAIRKGQIEPIKRVIVIPISPSR